MLLQTDPGLAERTGFSTAQLETLTRSVERKKQKLEGDINDYIRHKQEELRSYERELVEQYRSMDPAQAPPASDAAVSTARNADPPAHPAQHTEPADNKKLGPDEKAKRTKHTRVHKREQELCGLVTPIFLPLLDARDTSPPKKRKEKKRSKEDQEAAGPGVSPPQIDQGSPSRNADKGKENRRSKSKSRDERMEWGEGAAAGEAREGQRADGRRSKRAPIKKSSLRHNNAPRSRRKRVSLVIDDQIVHPSDNIIEPALTSPSETTLSTMSNSTASLDEVIDPQLYDRHDTPVHQDPVHHSLPLHMALPSTSPTKHTGHTLAESPQAEEYDPPKEKLEFEPPQTQTQTYLDPSPEKEAIIPQYASAAPIYANEPDIAEVDEEEFSTYVGGISGSGVDDVDQTGSFGYPSSLGASYLESYMQNRPLSVRMAAAEKAGLDADEKARLLRDKLREEE
ncbi:hypothetical protein BS50DRAFT_466602, partial [Corynespora cassiicola Philippines]